MILVHEGKADTFTAAQRIAASLRKIWRRPEYTVRVTSRYRRPGCIKSGRAYMVRLYRRGP